MRGISVMAVALAVTFGVAQSQQPAKAPPSDVAGALEKLGAAAQFEDMLVRALRHNVDVLAAESKVREAEAELRRTKMQVVNNVVTSRGKLEAAKKQIEFAQAELAQQIDLKKKNATTDSDYRRALNQFNQTQALVAEAEASLKALTGALVEEFSGKLGLGVPVGQHGPGMAGGGAGVGVGGLGTPNPDLPPRVAPEGSMADKIRKALDAPTKGHDFDGIPLADVLKFYRDLSNQVPIVASLGEQSGNPIKLSLNKELPLGAHFQALQDMAPGLKIYVRDYGFFCTFDNSPEDGMPFLDFWHPKGGA